MLKWKKSLDYNEDCASTAIVKGVGYISPTGPTNAPVYALNPATGDTLWKSSPAGLQLCSSPTVINGVVYVSNNGVYALNAKTGSVIWSNTSLGSVGTSPEVVGNLVYVASTSDNTLYALDVKTGKQVWSALLAGGINTPAVTVANGILYIGSYDNELHALNATTGKALWTASTGDFLYATPIVDNGLLCRLMR